MAIYSWGRWKWSMHKLLKIEDTIFYLRSYSTYMQPRMVERSMFTAFQE